MNLSKGMMASLAAPFAALLMSTTFMAPVQAADAGDQAQVAVSPPVFLQLEITSACTDKGTVFKIINRGNK